MPLPPLCSPLRPLGPIPTDGSSQHFYTEPNPNCTRRILARCRIESYNLDKLPCVRVAAGGKGSKSQWCNAPNSSSYSRRAAPQPPLHDRPIGQIFRIPHRRFDGVGGFVVAIEPSYAAVTAL